jgi:hypothetical protein
MAAAIFTLAACSDFLDVENPNVINAKTLDMEEESDLLMNSAYQEFASAYAWMTLRTAYFTDEAWCSHSDYYENAMNLRALDPGALNVPGRHMTELQPLSDAVAFSDLVLEALVGSPNAGTKINVAKAYFASGYALIWMGEKFCRGVIDVGPPLTSAMVLDSAITRLTNARTVALAAAPTLTGATKTFAESMADAALVGIARAQLQAGRKMEALAAAVQVPEGFVFNIQYKEVVGAGTHRLTNLPYAYSYYSSAAYSVAPPFRNLGDPRVPVKSPEEHGLRAMDGVTELWLQAKWLSLDAPIRLASKLEADYIAAEAEGPAAMLTLIQARRAENGLPAYAGPTDAHSVLVEFLEQRSREFFMEAKRLGDWRRHPDAISHIRPPGSEYHKSGYGVIGDQTCIPLPRLETDNNPNFTTGG